MQKYKYWDLIDSLPDGWTIDKHAGSPLAGYSFATNGSLLRGGKRALVRVSPTQMPIFNAVVVCSKMETTTPNPDKKENPAQIIDDHYAKTVNDLARAKFMHKLLADILVDLTICEIEGWCKREYINALVELINGIGRQPDMPHNASYTKRDVV